MAKGLLPLALRINLEPTLRLALALICDTAEEREDGAYVAIVSAMALAAMMGITEHGARKLIWRLRDAGFVTRGVKQSHWHIKLPHVRAINDVVRCNWNALGGRPERAPCVSTKWQVNRKQTTGPSAKKPSPPGWFPERKTAHGGMVFDEKNHPHRDTKPSPPGWFENAPYIGVNTLHGESSAETTNRQTATVDAHPEGQPGTTSEGGLAERGSPDASQQDATPDSVMPEPGGMVG